MNKYKVCVYAIALNESKFVDRWVDSMQEADQIYVLDTGSIDDTVEKLQKRGVNVKCQKISPWRFDVARNESLKMIPEDIDICVCVDLDEVFDKGWRTELEKSWTTETTQLSYNYIWSFDENGNPGTTFYIQKIHANKKYEWVNPVHEVLKPLDNVSTKMTVNDTILLKHYPDNNKSRSSYLPLLELSVSENPENDRNVHYLGREYMYYERWQECINMLHKHLKLKSATWLDERAASMRYIARSYVELDYLEEAIMWYEKAIAEAPYLREAYTELGFLYYNLKEYNKSIYYLEEALKITNKPKTYICESYCYNERIYDILSLDYYFTKNYYRAIDNAQKALIINPQDKRIQNNLEIYKNYGN